MSLLNLSFIFALLELCVCMYRAGDDIIWDARWELVG